MADISKITVPINGIDTELNLKDEVARERTVITTDINTPASVQTFNDGGDNIPLKSLVTEIVPIQAGSGVPSPSNVRAISGHNSIGVDVCGKNFSQITETSGSHNGITYTFNDDGTISASGSVPSGNSYKSVGHFILQAGTYTISGLPSSLVAEARKCAMVLCKDAYSGSVNVIKTINSNSDLSDQFTLTEATDCYLRIYIYPAAGAISDVIFSPQIELGETATSFEKFKGTIYTIPLGSTVYGGSLECVEGVGQITKAYVEFDGSSDETWYQAANGAFYIRAFVDTTWQTSKICNMYKYGGEVSSSADVTQDKTFYAQYSQSSPQYCRLWIKDTDYDTVTAFTTFLASNTLQVVYGLGTPTSLSVTGANIPTLSGVNNVYSDCGDIQSLEYFNNKADDIASLVRLMTRT